MIDLRDRDKIVEKVFNVEGYMAKEKKIRENKKLLTMKMKKKFSTSFNVLIIGFVIVALLAMANIVLMAKAGGVGIFSTPSRSVGIVLMFLAVVVNIFLIRVVAQSLTQSMVGPITEIQKAIKKLRNGDFDIDIKYAGKDEFSELADELRQTCDELHAVIEDAGYVLAEMGEGHFNVESKARESYVGDFEALIQAMDKLASKMSGTLSEIKTSSEQVMVGSEQLAKSAQELAEGASEQAGAVEELAATVENVTKISEESAENAVMAATSATNAAEDAKKSREEVNQLIDAMERITQTSREIEEIIAAIEDIAAQTNLLSLNASIEAARAGEAGRGFAVVADQIGKLATDSAQSAITTKELINKCIAEIGEGNAIVDNTMEAINTVLVNMETFAGMATGASEASKVQVSMLKEVEKGIDKITTVVQSNSATAQETSAVSEELSAQAINLEEMVGRFELKE